MAWVALWYSVAHPQENVPRRMLALVRVKSFPHSRPPGVFRQVADQTISLSGVVPTSR